MHAEQNERGYLPRRGFTVRGSRRVYINYTDRAHKISRGQARGRC